ncbi:MAG: fumarylacetoacetate hydrolase family protein [Rhodospirillales bacterium]
MTTKRIEKIARHIESEHRAKRRFKRLTGDLAPRSLDECYAIQNRLAAAFLDEDGPVTGYKIALTSPAVQKLCNVDQPAGGLIQADRFRQGPGNASVTDFVRLGVEFELAVRIGDAVLAGGAPWTRDSIMPHVAAIMPAFELIDDRDADYADLDGFSIAADRCWNGGVVLGTPVTDWQHADLSAAAVTMTMNNGETESGSTGATLGHPLDALAWLANQWAGIGRSMESGAVIMTGSVLATRFPKAGDHFRHEIAGLGAVELFIDG